MSLMRRLFGPDLSPEQRGRLDAWRKLPDEGGRIVVVDVETRGLDPTRDALISIGAVAVRDGRIALGGGFSVVLRQKDASSRENILVHGITGETQRQGLPPADALLDFLEYLGKSPLVAFHVAFDETAIRRAMKEYLGLDFRHRWLDLAHVLPAIRPSLNLRTLDDWVHHFSIVIEERHDALCDALATAELLLIASKEMSYDRMRSIANRRSLGMQI